MDKDYEDIRDTGDLDDNELRALVRDAFEQQMAVDPDDVSIAVRSGVVSLSGRVGTEEELRIAERIVTDMVGLEKVRNNLFVD
ncbi:MAG TPA: BON domain-containing protein, partial [Gemmatimonadaceae bacterium]|nr:BON domain-containing protein [Gemmatimonadaceae bacterium]